jgi:uncharacterized protein (AIM24 family)
MQGLKRVVGGGGLFLTRYAGPGSITFAAKVPGHIMAVDIAPGCGAAAAGSCCKSSRGRAPPGSSWPAS